MNIFENHKITQTGNLTDFLQTDVNELLEALHFHATEKFKGLPDLGIKFVATPIDFCVAGRKFCTAIFFERDAGGELTIINRAEQIARIELIRKQALSVFN